MLSATAWPSAACGAASTCMPPPRTRNLAAHKIVPNGLKLYLHSPVGILDCHCICRSCLSTVTLFSSRIVVQLRPLCNIYVSGGERSHFRLPLSRRNIVLLRRNYINMLLCLDYSVGRFRASAWAGAPGTAMLSSGQLSISLDAGKALTSSNDICAPRVSAAQLQRQRYMYVRAKVQLQAQALTAASRRPEFFAARVSGLNTFLTCAITPTDAQLKFR